MTSIEAAEIVIAVIVGSALFQEVGTNVFPEEKPDNFNGECIVVNALPMTREQLQEGRVNVNVFVPNLKLNITGRIDRSQPDMERLKYLGGLVIELFTDYYTDQYSIEVESEYPHKNEGTDEYLNNIRLLIQNTNI